MISQKLQSLRRAVWTWQQPLTRLPAMPRAPISDLFVWRSSDEWQTFFELIDISSLFGDGHAWQHVTLIFFDESGQRISKTRIGLQANCRQTLDISSMVGRAHGTVGTFAIFHPATPSEITKLGSFLAERGYVSYRYRDTPLKAYVHGNLDAIAQGPDDELHLLGGRSFLNREYSLQHELQQSANYELGMVNPTPTPQRCALNLISAHGGGIISTQLVDLAPGGLKLVPIQVNNLESVRLVIKSRLIMARPLVFRIQNLRLDVFHG
jgi:hypothetical protein